MKPPIKNIEELGYHVRQIRKEQQLTQEDLSGLSGKGKRFISELENGKPTLEIQRVLEVLDTLGWVLVLAKKGDE